MLQSLDASISVCLERAYQAREAAKDAVDKDSRAFWLATAQKWQDLAQSYEVQGRGPLRARRAEARSDVTGGAREQPS